MLRRKFVCTLAGLMLGAISTLPMIAQEASPANDMGKKLPSPPAQASVMLGGKSVTIDYNMPSMRGRTIFGGLLPYGQVWRTGANPATTLKTAVNLKIGDLSVPAGHLHDLFCALADHLEAHHQQADRPVGHRIQPGPGSGSHRHAARLSAFCSGRAICHQV
jgi:Protein of unknown function (DUF2911)